MAVCPEEVGAFHLLFSIFFTLLFYPTGSETLASSRSGDPWGQVRLMHLDGAGLGRGALPHLPPLSARGRPRQVINSGARESSSDEQLGEVSSSRRAGLFPWTFLGPPRGTAARTKSNQ